MGNWIVLVVMRIEEVFEFLREVFGVSIHENYNTIKMGLIDSAGITHTKNCDCVSDFPILVAFHRTSKLKAMPFHAEKNTSVRR